MIRRSDPCEISWTLRQGLDVAYVKMNEYEIQTFDVIKVNKSPFSEVSHAQMRYRLMVITKVDCRKA